MTQFTCADFFASGKWLFFISFSSQLTCLFELWTCKFSIVMCQWPAVSVTQHRLVPPPFSTPSSNAPPWPRILRPRHWQRAFATFHKSFKYNFSKSKDAAQKLSAGHNHSEKWKGTGKKKQKKLWNIWICIQIKLIKLA